MRTLPAEAVDEIDEAHVHITWSRKGGGGYGGMFIALSTGVEAEDLRRSSGPMADELLDGFVESIVARDVPCEEYVVGESSRKFVVSGEMWLPGERGYFEWLDRIMRFQIPDAFPMTVRQVLSESADANSPGSFVVFSILHDGEDGHTRSSVLVNPETGKEWSRWVVGFGGRDYRGRTRTNPQQILKDLENYPNPVGDILDELVASISMEEIKPDIHIKGSGPEMRPLKLGRGTWYCTPTVSGNATRHRAEEIKAQLHLQRAQARRPVVFAGEVTDAGQWSKTIVHDGGDAFFEVEDAAFGASWSFYCYFVRDHFYR